jgi:hypothetical protein
MRPLTSGQERIIDRARERGAGRGPPPTIGDLKAEGMAGFAVFCTGSIGLQRCWHQRHFRWEELGLADSLPFPAVSGLPLRCSRCGGRSFHVTPDRRPAGPEPQSAASGNAPKPAPFFGSGGVAGDVT